MANFYFTLFSPSFQNCSSKNLIFLILVNFLFNYSFSYCYIFISHLFSRFSIVLNKFLLQISAFITRCFLLFLNTFSRSFFCRFMHIWKILQISATKQCVKKNTFSSWGPFYFILHHISPIIMFFFYPLPTIFALNYSLHNSSIDISLYLQVFFLPFSFLRKKRGLSSMLGVSSYCGTN